MRMPPVYPAVAVCDELGISRATLRRWELAGRIPKGTVIEFNGTKYVRADQFDRVRALVSAPENGS